MLLYEDHTIQINYSPATDVMDVALLVARDYDNSEIKKAFMSIVSTIKEYNVTRLLLDFTLNTLDLTEAEYKHSISLLAVGLMHTPLRKIARIGTPDPVREHKINGMYEGIKNAVDLRITFDNFTNKPDALAWLQKD